MTTAVAIFIVGLIFMGLGIMLIGYLFRRPGVAISSAAVWLVFGIYCRSLSATLWDIYYLLFVVGVCLFFLAFIEGIILRPKPEDTEPEEDLYDREVEDYIARREKFRERMGRTSNSGREKKEESFSEKVKWN